MIVWPVGQVVKTPPFHGGIMGSNPVRVIFGGLAQLGERLPYKQRVTGSSPVTSIESLAQLVEHLTFNQRVDSSSLSRLIGQVTRQNAGVAELADALDLGSSVYIDVGVQVPSPAFN